MGDNRAPGQRREMKMGLKDLFASGRKHLQWMRKEGVKNDEYC